METYKVSYWQLFWVSAFMIGLIMSLAILAKGSKYQSFDLGNIKFGLTYPTNYFGVLKGVI